MSKHIELAKKLKALSEKGIDGEKVNAEKMLNDLLKKHHITIEDIEGEQTQNYFFKVDKNDVGLFNQIVNIVKYGLKIFGEIPENDIQKFELKGNFVVECTASEFIEIKTMFEHYSNLYKNELDIFFSAFLTANGLLIRRPISESKTTADLTPEELERWKREQIMASGIKTQTFFKRLKGA